MEMITPTLDNIKERFDECNEKYFSGKLKRPRMKITQSKKYLGKTYYYPNNKTRRAEDIEIYFSEMFEMSDEMFTDLMCHEMIHLYLAKKYIIEKNEHGPRWQSMANELNEKYGLHITKYFEATPKFKYGITSKLIWIIHGLLNS